MENLVHVLANADIVKEHTPDWCKTKDVTKIYRKVYAYLSTFFSCKDTKYLLDFFALHPNIPFPQPQCEPLRKQTRPKAKRPYSVALVTESEDVYKKYATLLPTILFDSYTSVSQLDSYDVIKLYQVDVYAHVLEEVEHSVHVEESQILLETHVENLSVYEAYVPQQLRALIVRYLPNSIKQPTSIQEARSVYQEQAKNISLTLTDLRNFEKDQTIPQSILLLQKNIARDFNIPEQLLSCSLDFSLDEEVYAAYQKKAQKNQACAIFRDLQNCPELLESEALIAKITCQLLLEDFSHGLYRFIEKHQATPIAEGTHLAFTQSTNLFIGHATPISYHLTSQYPVAVLSGANSGGKTTLLEQILSLVSLSHLRFPAPGTVTMPTFSAVHYFTKSAGSASRGAFETALLELANIDPGKTTLVLADEMEAVTEPTVALTIIEHALSHFATHGSQAVFATHMASLLKPLPHVRIDGICAQGLDEQNKLLVDHNPRIGVLAKSTPELIIQRLASTQKRPFLTSLHALLTCQDNLLNVRQTAYEAAQIPHATSHNVPCRESL